MITSEKTCEELFYTERFWDEMACGAPATHTINIGTEHEYPLCAEHAAEAHPTRIKPISPQSGRRDEING